MPYHDEPQPCPNHDRVGCSLCFTGDLLGPEPLIFDELPYPGIHPDF